MSLLGRLFGRSGPDKIQYLQAMSEMAAESERTYRGMMDLYSSDVALGVLSGAAASPTGPALYMARLYGAMFMAAAYARVARSPSDVEEFVNVATGVALEPLQGGSSQGISREEAGALTFPFATRVLKAVLAGYEAGPWMPGSAASAHLDLAEPLHETLAESIGVEDYTEQVRERFDHMVHGSAAAALAHSAKWAGV